jgi:anti-sigma factor RsiW
MTCRDLIGFLMEYLDGGLPAEARAAFERHLAICRDCRIYLRNYQETVRAGRAALQMSDEPVSPDVPEELVRAILSARTV